MMPLSFFLAALLAATQPPPPPPSQAEGAAPTAARRPSEPPKPPQQPFANETLTYSVNWPSGLSLGQAQLLSHRSGDRSTFAFSLDAAIPGFIISDSYQSTAKGEFCSTEFIKTFTHGNRKAAEKTTFDLQKGTATRKTLVKDAGVSEFSAPGCPRDGLSFLYFLRRELSQGRLPPAQTIYFGAAYQLKLEYGGAQSIKVNDKAVIAERLRATLKGPASEHTVELFFTRDEARTPVLIRAPFPQGAFTLELVR